MAPPPLLRYVPRCPALWWVLLNVTSRYPRGPLTAHAALSVSPR